MGKPSEEFHAFDSLMGKLLTVPKSAIDEKYKAHKAKAALDRYAKHPAVDDYIAKAMEALR